MAIFDFNDFVGSVRWDIGSDFGLATMWPIVAVPDCLTNLVAAIIHFKVESVPIVVCDNSTSRSLCHLQTCGRTIHLTKCSVLFVHSTENPLCLGLQQQYCTVVTNGLQKYGLALTGRDKQTRKYKINFPKYLRVKSYDEYYMSIIYVFNFDDLILSSIVIIR